RCAPASAAPNCPGTQPAVRQLGSQRRTEKAPQTLLPRSGSSAAGSFGVSASGAMGEGTLK
ncbi:hypothetical protein, partial [Methanothrix soehngenii]|uniref:hypothetical protein n=1 Tax=Methanothrix soehngenii TaxID=2223 RepID=UPI00300C5B5D